VRAAASFGMDPCHTKPFVRPGMLIEASANVATPSDPTCDYCGATQLEWRKCKLICANCKQINKSCADL
jgi:hypothetical protein